MVPRGRRGRRRHHHHDLDRGDRVHRGGRGPARRPARVHHVAHDLGGLLWRLFQAARQPRAGARREDRVAPAGHSRMSLIAKLVPRASTLR